MPCWDLHCQDALLLLLLLQGGLLLVTQAAWGLLVLMHEVKKPQEMQQSCHLPGLHLQQPQPGPAPQQQQ
jgi:hypothetical protein